MIWHKDNVLKQQQKDTQQQKKENKSTCTKKEFSFDIEECEIFDKELRKPRSRAYMEIFEAIDILSATDEEIIAHLKEKMEDDTAEEFLNMTTEELLEEIKASIREEFQSIPIKETLHGILSMCYIDGCDCHAISAEGEIIEHFDEKFSMPENLRKGRVVFHKYPNCRCVEVYSDCCRVIGMDASVTKIPNADICD